MRQTYPELNCNAIVYAFQFSCNQSKSYTLENGQKVTFQPRQVLYIGIDTTDGFVRYSEHLKPSKRNDTSNSFHAWIQDNVGDWEWIRIMEINGIDNEDVKKSVHAAETELTKLYEPYFAMLKK